MDVLILLIGVVGLSISGWVLRGYFVNVPPTSQQKPAPESEPDQDESQADLPKASYVSSEEHQQVLKRLEQLEKTGLTSKVEQDSVGPHDTISSTKDSRGGVNPETELAATDTTAEDANSEKWKQIVALQEAYQRERQKERDIDYEREQTLFDVSQGPSGRIGDWTNEDVLGDENETEQRMLDNQYQIGEDLESYQKRMSQFATLSKEVLIMRLESANTQLKEQQERHQASLLNIIATLIEKGPGDVNLKSIAQSSYATASSEITDDDGETNMENFQKMFHESFGR
ncbi:hypothetical protein [Spirosoma luteum]|uniref:hypothetical protein n=1 Tax=Spirosoma luteum TaxID=431553 RepID=UPI00036EE0DD|nr:hypothetical protein [Spirosoma luteum]